MQMMAGAKNPKAIDKWGQNPEGLAPLLERLWFDGGYGRQSTWYRVLASIDVDDFKVRVSQSVDQITTDPLSVAEKGR